LHPEGARLQFVYASVDRWSGKRFGRGGHAGGRGTRRRDHYHNQPPTGSAGSAHTIHGIDLAEPLAAEKILDDSFLRSKPVDYVLYIPARGEVGIALEESTKEMVEPSLAYSVRPYLKLHSVLKPGRTVALSGFITMPPLMKIYGAMTFTKIAMERLAVENPSALQIIRIGMFHSNSVRGIMILAQRRFLRDPSFQPDWRAEWKASGKRFPDFFYSKNYSCEEETYRHHSGGKPFRPHRTRRHCGRLQTGVRRRACSHHQCAWALDLDGKRNAGTAREHPAAPRFHSPGPDAQLNGNGQRVLAYRAIFWRMPETGLRRSLFRAKLLHAKTRPGRSSDSSPRRSSSSSE
jgi:hypothetical protein